MLLVAASYKKFFNKDFYKLKTECESNYCELVKKVYDITVTSNINTIEEIVAQLKLDFYHNNFPLIGSK